MEEPRRVRIPSIAGATLVAALLTFSAAPAQALDLGALCDVLRTCEAPREGKAECWWTHTGANVPIGTPGVPPGASYATQLITLHCPNHVEMGKLQYGWKSCVTPATGADCSRATGLSVTDLGRTDNSPCSDWSRTWLVYAPNINLYDAWFRVHTLKDVDCDKKPDDWNHDFGCGEPTTAECRFQDKPEPKVWRQNNDGSVTPYGDGALDENPCYYDNTFYTGPASEDKPRSAGGTRDPRFFDYFPQPDGEINECDWQTWEYQWLQFN